MISESSGCAKLAAQLGELSQQRATGKLIVSKGDRQWHLYFLLGHLLYATGGQHRIRRWDRALMLCCPDFAADPNLLSTANLWEYQLLHQAVTQAYLSLNQAKAVIQSIAKEVFFTMVRHSDFTSRWLPSPRQSSSKKNLNLPLSSEEIEQTFQKAMQLGEQWQAMGLSYICPDQAPVLKNTDHLQKQISSDTFFGLTKLFNGQHTLWDIAAKKKQSVIGVTRSLHYFVQQGTIEVRTVPDLPSPIEQMRLVVSAVNLSAPLIACIDDSAVVGHTLETILLPAGYRVLKIQDPLAEMSVLVQQKPALIFLDLIMPDPNGYVLCSFLRQTSVFRETPIIILTSHDGVVERVRANLTGASDFLSKPPEPRKVLEIVQKYLQENSRQVFSATSSEMAHSG